jgi:hypothetical protein
VGALARRARLAHEHPGQLYQYPWSIMTGELATWSYDAAADAARMFLRVDPDLEWQAEARTLAAMFPPFGDNSIVSPIKDPVAAH